MNLILRTAFMVYLGILKTTQTILLTPSVIKSALKSVETYFVPVPQVKRVDTKCNFFPEIELSGLSDVHIKDLFKAQDVVNTEATFKTITKNVPIIMHMQLLQDLKAKFDLLKEKAALENLVSTQLVTEKRLTQTEAYLGCYQAGIDSTFDRALKDHKVLIDSIIAREKELSETHYFLYHAHKKELIILHDFIKMLHSCMHLLAPRLNFTFMRFKNTLTLPYQNVNEYLDAHPNICDHDTLTMSHMSSVNLALFGSHNNSGECTFKYFLHDTSVNFTSLYERLSPIFSHYKFDTKYLTELTDLSSHLTSPTGNLLQICIPHDMVDDLVYLSKPYGMPYNAVVLKKHYDYKKHRHTSIRPLLEYMRTSPSSIDNLSSWQARLMFFDPMVDMHPSIKIFRYNTIIPENMTLYKQKLQDITIRLILDYLKVVIDSPRKEPLVKLYTYMMMQKDNAILSLSGTLNNKLTQTI